ncbi:MAG: metalloregulator ArsR/SmtB family transcription factor [Planctomycetota bacterium]
MKAANDLHQSESSTDLRDLAGALSAIADSVRLRMLRVLESEELAVGEIAQVLQMPQSTVSRRLKGLADHGWVQRRAAGTATLYRCVPDDLPEELRGLWLRVRAATERAADVEGDARRLRAVVAERKPSSAAFFGRLGAGWDDVSRELFGDRYASEALVALLPEGQVVADIGCGTGAFAAVLAPVSGEVIAIDREPAMLEAARERVGARSNVRFELGSAEALPLGDASVDLAVLSLVLHHADEPTRVLAEVARILRPGGRLVLVDMLAHTREELLREMGHAWAGFERSQLAAWCEDAGLWLRSHRPLPSTPEAKGPDVFAAIAVKPASEGSRVNGEDGYEKDTQDSTS